MMLRQVLRNPSEHYLFYDQRYFLFVIVFQVDPGVYHFVLCILSFVFKKYICFNNSSERIFFVDLHLSREVDYHIRRQEVLVLYIFRFMEVYEVFRSHRGICHHIFPSPLLPTLSFSELFNNIQVLDSRGRVHHR